MNKYSYKARDRNGNLVNGEVEANSESAAAKLIRSRGYIVVGLRPAGGLLSLSLGKFTNRVTSGDLTSFTRQLATMINAGLPITDALTILRTQSKPAVQSVASQILADVEGGQSLSASLARYPKVFPNTYIALVKSGETGGVLDKVLARLADNLEKQQEFRGKVKGAMIYPVIIVIGMIAVSIIMVVFVIPRLTTLYDQLDVELPLTTKIMTGISDLFISYWWAVVIVLTAIFWAFTLYRRTENGQRAIAEFIFKIPILGELRRQIILTELTRTLSLMVSSGVPILEGLTVAKEVVGNIIVRDALEDVIHSIEKGFPISYSFSKHPEAFPFILSQMISVGEETGKMDEVLDRVSHVFEVQSEEKVKALSSAIEPIVMIVLGIGVAILVVSIIMPIYNLTSSI